MAALLAGVPAAACELPRLSGVPAAVEELVAARLAGVGVAPSLPRRRLLQRLKGGLGHSLECRRALHCDENVASAPCSRSVTNIAKLARVLSADVYRCSRESFIHRTYNVPLPMEGVSRLSHTPGHQTLFYRLPSGRGYTSTP